MNVSFEQAKKIIDTETDCIILDVREPEEYITGHARNAVNFPLDTINAETARQIIASTADAVLVYCRSGSRSSMAAKKLADLGYERVYNIGSLAGWPYGLEVD